MRWFGALPLRRQLFISIGLLLLPLLVAAAWSGRTTLRERQNDLRDQARLVAVTTAAYVEADLASLDRIANTLSLNPYVRTLDGVNAAPVLRSVVENSSAILALVLVRPDGSEVTRFNNSNDLQNDRVAAPTAVISKGGRAVMPMAQTRSGLHYTSIGYPVRTGEGVVVGALWMLVSLESIQSAFTRLPLPVDSVVTITDASNIVLARSLQPEKYVGVALHGGAHFSDGEDSVTHTGSDGVFRMYGRAPIVGGPWTLSVGIPMRVAYDKMMGLWRRSLTIFGIGLVGWLAAAIALSKRLSSSVQELDGAAQRIAAGDFTPIKAAVMPNREFQELQDAFVQMLQRFNETTGELDRHLAEERRIRQELQSLQRQVIRQERLAAVGQLVSGVAHEINNPLQAILGFAELLQVQGDVPDSIKPDLRLIQKESARACAIIRNLAIFARQQPGEAAPMGFGDVISAVVELRQRRLEAENIMLEIDDRSSSLVLAVLAELQQVALNFVVNAEQAIMGSGRLPGQITIRAYDVDGYVRFEVEDTGPGVPPEDESRLFQPFFTTKPVGMGTGLGLSVSYGIVDSLCGRIGYRRAPAGGSIFYFELPAMQSEGGAADS